MHCKNCNYPLWQMTRRTCPECGTAFKPSEFEFVPNAVRFCCPHCEQTYYGTSPTGHLEPAAFGCVKCGNMLEMDGMVLLPAGNVSESMTQVSRGNWADRRTRGWFTAFFATMGQSMASPNALIDAVPTESGTRRAIIYAWINLTAQFVFSGVVFPVAGMLTDGFGLDPVTSWIVSGLTALCLPTLLMLTWVLIAHGWLRMTGPCQPLARTVQAVAYTSGCNVMSCIPCVGFLTMVPGLIWWSIASCFTLARGHKIAGWRGGVAGAMLSVAVMVTVGAFIMMIVAAVWGIGAVLGAGPGGMAGPGAVTVVAPTMPGAGTGSAATAYATLAAVYPRGRMTDHPAILVTDNWMTEDQFYLPGTSTTGATAAGVSLNTLETVGWQHRSRIMTMGNAGQVRVGDIVFVTQDIDFRSGDRRLWVIIANPDPSQNPAATTFSVVTVGGTQIEISADDFGEKLSEQNELRRTSKLPEIEDPRMK